jgi:hypothetical protein
MWFWQSSPLGVREREISESIKALKTLRVEDGRVSVDPVEVTGRPGYLAERARAGARVRSRHQVTTTAQASWHLPDEIGLDSFAVLIAASLAESRRNGHSVDEALIRLRYLLSAGATE